MFAIQTDKAIGKREGKELCFKREWDFFRFHNVCTDDSGRDGIIAGTSVDEVTSFLILLCLAGTFFTCF